MVNDTYETIVDIKLYTTEMILNILQKEKEVWSPSSLNATIVYILGTVLKNVWNKGLLKYGKEKKSMKISSSKICLNKKNKKKVLVIWSC